MRVTARTRRRVWYRTANLRSGVDMTHTLTYPETAAHDAAGHLVIDGCDLVDLAHEFGTPLFVYEEKGAARPVPPLRPGVRQAHRRLRGRLREQGVPRGRHHPAGRRGGPLDRRLVGRRVPHRPGGRRAHRPHVLPRQQQDAGRTRLRARQRHRVRGGRQLRRVGAAGAAGGRTERAPTHPSSHHPGHRGPHPRVHPDRAGGLQVRLRPGAGAGDRGHQAGAGRAAPGTRGPARPHRQPDLRARRLPGHHRPAGRPDASRPPTTSGSRAAP